MFCNFISIFVKTGSSAVFMLNANLKLSIGVERTSEDSGDEHRGNSTLKCKNIHDVVSVELNSMSN